MPDYEIVVSIKDVAEGDATTVAQDIWERHALDLDAELGSFELRILEIRSGNRYQVDSWTPQADE